MKEEECYELTRVEDVIKSVNKIFFLKPDEIVTTSNSPKDSVFKGDYTMRKTLLNKYRLSSDFMNFL